MRPTTLRVEVVGRDLPGIRFADKEPVHLGIQRGDDVIEPVPADRRTVKFVAEFEVAKKKDGSPNFLGPYSQGKPDDRFFYLSWCVKTPSGALSMFRRLKVRLGHLTWRDIERTTKTGKPITVMLSLTDAKGGPLCATPPASHISWSGG